MPHSFLNLAGTPQGLINGLESIKRYGVSLRLASPNRCVALLKLSDEAISRIGGRHLFALDWMNLCRVPIRAHHPNKMQVSTFVICPCLDETYKF